MQKMKRVASKVHRSYGIMADKLSINEVLCFVLNKFGKFMKALLKSTLLSFYNEDELSAAKDMLFADAA